MWARANLTRVTCRDVTGSKVHNVIKKKKSNCRVKTRNFSPAKIYFFFLTAMKMSTSYLLRSTSQHLAMMSTVSFEQFA